MVVVVVVVCGGLMIETKFGRNGVEISKSNYFFIFLERHL